MTLVLSNKSYRDEKWTKSIAAGSKDFVDKVKLKLGIRAKGRDVKGTDSGYQLRESTNSYTHLFEPQNSDFQNSINVRTRRGMEPYAWWC